LKIAGRVAFLTLFSGYQPPPAIVATHPFEPRCSSTYRGPESIRAGDIRLGDYRIQL
jgi:hypothetical protein